MLTLWYGYPYDELTNKNLKIYQLAITSLAALVGVGTVYNSTRSSSSAAHSLKLSIDKENREQSSHLIALSESLEIPLVAPIHKKSFKEDYPDTTLLRGGQVDYYKKLKNYIDNNQDNIEVIFGEQALRLERYNEAVKEFDKYMNKVIKNILQPRETEHFLSVLNSGKGTSVNIEYEFSFENLKEFSGYEFSSINDEPTFRNTPSYSISIGIIDDESELPFIKVTDGDLTRDIKEMSQYFGFDEANYLLDDSHIMYLNLVSPGESHSFPIPSSFSVLAKHYMICKHYKENYILSDSELSPQTITSFKEAKVIMPKGKVLIRYTDDEITRTDSKSGGQIELVYEICFKETTLNFYDDTISNVYLEAKYISTKKS